jgi:hypothetical protein
MPRGAAAGGGGGDDGDDEEAPGGDVNAAVANATGRFVSNVAKNTLVRALWGRWCLCRLTCASSWRDTSGCASMCNGHSLPVADAAVTVRRDGSRAAGGEVCARAY